MLLARNIFPRWLTPTGPAAPRKRRRTRPSPPVEDLETLPQIDDAGLQMDVDIGEAESSLMLVLI